MQLERTLPLRFVIQLRILPFVLLYFRTKMNIISLTVFQLSTANFRKAGKGKKGKNPKVVEVIDSEKEEDEEEGDDGDDEDDEDEDGEGDDEGEHLPKAILKRIGGLMQLHGKSKADIDAEYRAERAVLEAKFDARRAAVYEQRRQIISGLVEPVLESEGNTIAIFM